ncbi:putative transcription factor/ chromatin remodeling BED-type(Zn) family protein [Tanacetum coccineum]
MWMTKKYVARWAYESAIPFHAFEKDSFKMLLEVVGQFGPGLPPPTRYELSTPLLKEEVERTKNLVKRNEKEWKDEGCSIMTDAWSDRKRRSIMNLCVNSRMGTVFLSSKECSGEAHTSEYIYEYVDACIQEVGAEHVVQIVTDNASNNMGAAALLKVTRPKIFRTSCATHTINLMLEGIGALPRFKKILDQAKKLTIFIYSHHKTLAMTRDFTKKRDIVRPGVKKFASSFLTLQSLSEKKEQLRHMFSSTEWEECRFSGTVKGKAAYATVLSTTFWAGVSLCLKVFTPLVKALRMVDADWKTSMGQTTSCPMATKDDRLKCRNAIKEGKLKKQAKRQHDEAIRSEVRMDSNESLEDEAHDHSMKEPNVFCPMDNFANTINPEQSLKKGKGKI